jgi:hypothetical protein
LKRKFRNTDHLALDSLESVDLALTRQISLACAKPYEVIHYFVDFRIPFSKLVDCHANIQTVGDSMSVADDTIDGRPPLLREEAGEV